MKKKILITYATYGNGHKAIANYISNYIKSKNDNVEILSLNLLEESNKILGGFENKVSDFFMIKFPHGFNAIYNLINHRGFGDFASFLNEGKFKNKKLIEKIKKFDPDITISTHFSGSNLLQYCNKKGYTNTKTITVVTDYKTHLLWLKQNKKEELIVIGNKKEIPSIEKKHIKIKNIKPIGIPIFPQIKKTFKKNKLIKECGFTGKKPICVFFGGGGNGGIHSLPFIKEIIKKELNIDFIFVSGNNKKSKEKVDKWINEYNKTNIKTFGYVNNVPELLETCDFVITKPGGAQITETLYYKKPVIMINSSQGQEKGNINFIEENGYGVWFKSKKKFIDFIDNIDKDINILNYFKTNISKNKSDKAMEKFYKEIEKILKN